MPSREQLEVVRSDIEDVIGRRYIEGDGDRCGCRYAPEGGGNVGCTYCYPPESGEAVPFASLDETSKVELLTTYVAWDGFDFEQDRVVIQNVIDGKGIGEWMDGVEPDPIPTQAETYALFTEMVEDIALRKMPEDPASPKTYEQQLQDAIDLGRFMQQGKDGRER